MSRGGADGVMRRMGKISSLSLPGRVLGQVLFCGYSLRVRGDVLVMP